MKLIAIKEKLEENEAFIHLPLCQETLYMTIEFYGKIGFTPPWICYYVEHEGALVGSAGYKGKPVDGAVEIAYGTFEPFRNQGIGAGICKLLIDLAQRSDPTVKITARTLPEENFSTRILKRNGFEWLGTVIDPEDGPVWEWEVS